MTFLGMAAFFPGQYLRQSFWLGWGATGCQLDGV